MSKALQSCYDGLFRRVDGASLGLFRILFGVILAWDAVRFFQHGRIYRNYIQPEFHFKYYGFEWVEPLPGIGMYVVFATLGLLAVLIALGVFYRFAIICFFLGFSYIFLIDQTTYLNHFYLVILIAFLMIFLPADRCFSLSAWLRGTSRNTNVPAWSIWILRAQMEVMLLYAGIVKINSDWLQLQPLEIWLQNRYDGLIVEPFFTSDLAIALGAYGSIALHVIGAPLLLWRKTRIYAFAAYCCFHLMNHFTFNIGIFPWFTIAATLLFFDPDWPRQFARWLMSHAPSWIRSMENRLPAMLADITAHQGATAPALPGNHAVIATAVVVWTVLQVLIPARHLLYPGNPSWTEEGHRFAWQMMLRQKRGLATFTVTDPATGRVWTVDNRQFLTRRQIAKMSSRPDMILQYAHHLADQWQHLHGVRGAQVHTVAMISLNGRRPQALIDPAKDLAKVERNLKPASWIVPLTEPLFADGRKLANNRINR